MFDGKRYLYFATRNYGMRIQKVGGTWAEIDSGFGKDAWTIYQGSADGGNTWYLSKEEIRFEDGKLYVV